MHAKTMPDMLTITRPDDWHLHLRDGDSLGGDETSPFIRHDIRNVPVSIILTGMFKRTTVKYGDRGYRFSVLEAGHAGA